METTKGTSNSLQDSLPKSSSSDSSTEELPTHTLTILISLGCRDLNDTGRELLINTMRNILESERGIVDYSIKLHGRLPSKCLPDGSIVSNVICEEHYPKPKSKTTPSKDSEPTSWHALVFASEPSYNEMWPSKKKYDEDGGTNW